MTGALTVAAQVWAALNLTTTAVAGLWILADAHRGDPVTNHHNRKANR